MMYYGHMGQSQKVRKRDGTEFTTYDMLYLLNYFSMMHYQAQSETSGQHVIINNKQLQHY